MYLRMYFSGMPSILFCSARQQNRYASVGAEAARCGSRRWGSANTSREFVARSVEGSISSALAKQSKSLIDPADDGRVLLRAILFQVAALLAALAGANTSRRSRSSDTAGSPEELRYVQLSDLDSASCTVSAG